MSSNGSVVQKDTKITPANAVYVSQGNIPKYRPFNFETFGIEVSANGIVGGLIYDKVPTRIDTVDTVSGDKTDPQTPPAIVAPKIRGLYTCFTGNERGKTSVEAWAGIYGTEIQRVLNVIESELDKGCLVADLKDNIKSLGTCLDSVELWPIRYTPPS